MSAMLDFPSAFDYIVDIEKDRRKNFMRLERIQQLMKDKDWKYQYTEVKGCGSIDFEYGGVRYHIWEFEDNGFGAETNVRNGGHSEDIMGDYEAKIIQILEPWKSGSGN